MTTVTASPAGSNVLQPLSPARMNRNPPLQSTPLEAMLLRGSENRGPLEDARLPPVSPTRKANLFADYRPKSSNAPSSTFGLPSSPSLPEFTSLRSHNRTNSDVQGLVKRFEHLDVRDRDAENMERRRRHEAEVRRAQIGREEAESDVKRLRAELRAMKKENDEGRERERLVAKRLNVVVEELSNNKEAHASACAVYDKEIRKARKEAFKSSSAVLKLQEELKSTRNSLRITQSGFEIEKQKVQRKDQETFEAQYQLVAAQEELEQLRSSLRIAQEETEALKMSLKDEEVARLAAEGMIALPLSGDKDDDLLLTSPPASPRKYQIISPSSEDKENQHMSPRKSAQNRMLQADLAFEKSRRQAAEEMVEFIRLECKFQCCPCRTAQNPPVQVTEDMAETIRVCRDTIKNTTDLATPQDAPMGGLSDDVAMSRGPIQDEGTRVAHLEISTSRVNIANVTPSQSLQDAMDCETSRLDSPEAVPTPAILENADTFENERPKQTPHHSPMETAIVPTEQQLSRPEGRLSTKIQPSRTPSPSDFSIISSKRGARKIPLRSPSPETRPHDNQATPFRNAPSVKTITTTTTIPMQFTPISKPVAMRGVDHGENVPPAFDEGLDIQPFDREAALAAIQYRRGRARSIANGQTTPRKQMLEGISINERRDISAPVIGSKPASGVVLAKSASVGRTVAKRMM